jgi:hypothetical protein
MPTFEFSGFDDFERQLREAERELGALNGEILGGVKFDPDNPGDVNRAIKGMEQMVDRTLGPYRLNRFIEPLIAETKESLREQILMHVAQARSK